MKKIICLSFVLALSVFVVANAKTTATIVSGDKSVVKQATTCSVEFDFTDASLEGKSFDGYMAEKDAKYLEDWKSDMAEAKTQFIKRWNKKNKKGMQLVEGDNAPYKMVVKVRTIDTGNSAMSVIFGGFGGGGANMSGELFIYQDANPVLNVDFNDVNGSSEYTETRRIKSVFSEVVDVVWKKIK